MDNLTKINLDNYKPLRDVVFENLRNAILEGNLKSGKDLWKFNWQNNWELVERQ